MKFMLYHEHAAWQVHVQEGLRSLRRLLFQPEQHRLKLHSEQQALKHVMAQ